MTSTAGDDARDPNRLLRSLVEAVEAEIGDSFFRSLVRHLATTLGVQYAFVSELTRGRTHFRTLAVWGRGAPLDGFEIPLAGTPCEAVLCGEMRAYPEGLQQAFPSDHGLADWGAVSYAGVPMVDSTGGVVGHFAIMHDAPMPDGARILDVMRIFAARTVAELERQRALDELRSSQEQIERIVDAASDGIVAYHEDGTLVVFNRGAERILRCKAEEALGTSVFRFATEEGKAAVGLALERLRNEPDALIFSGEAQALTARRADGTIFTQEASLSRSESQGRPIYTVIFRDVDEYAHAAAEFQTLQRDAEYMREELRSVYNFEEIVGRSRALREVFEAVERVAATDATVLILGETGTGKELVARAVHAGSARKDRPLVKVNCAALPPGLVESELFGHEKGAFTGASERRVGRFEQADGGTIFLDEVGEIPLDIQVKLLRVLQEREFERAGGSRTLRVDVRVVAATNRDLLRAIDEGKFRQDLYYRLHVFPLTLPPLRAREGDVPLLVHHFVQRHAARIGRRIERVSEATLARLERYPWPGNVRELENVVERAVILSRGPELEIDAALLDPRALAASSGRVVPQSEGEGRAPTLEELERSHIVQVLRATSWRVEGEGGAALRLGLHPNTLRSRMRKLGIRRSDDALA